MARLPLLHTWQYCSLCKGQGSAAWTWSACSWCGQLAAQGQGASSRLRCSRGPGHA
ncbi:hypothetical protein HaLaN_25720, partial [Haematococcus lacustris]